MKFIIDENLSPRLASWLCERGHDAVHVLDVGLGGQPDTDIIARAGQEGRMIITQDSDFDDANGVLRLAHGNAPTAKLISWLEPRLEAALARIAAGERCVVLS